MKLAKVTCLLLLAAASCAPGAGDPADAPVVTQPEATDAIPLLEEGIRLPPVDEAERDPSFSAFRERLLDIVERRDAAALLEVVASDIRYSFGNGGGRKAFEEYWNLGTGDSKLWDELGRVLRLGGSFREGRFVAPYTFSAWPDGVDGFEHLATICEDAVARAEPSPRAEPFVRLDHHVLPVGPEDRHGEPWRQVILPDERRAWIEDECVRSHVDYRAAFEKRDGEWRMVFFIAGD